MRAVAVFPGNHEVKVIDEAEPPAPSGTEVLLGMREVGICGTDREIGRFEYGTAPVGRDHFVLGHEALADVLAIGPAVETIHVGDLVVPTVRRPCTDPHCEPCRAGRQDFCKTGGFHERGIHGADGFLAERVIEDEANLVRVPRQLEDVAILVEPLSIAAKASYALDAIKSRLPWESRRVRALVLGGGPIGILAAMVFVAHGVETTVYSLQEVTSPRAALVRGIGAAYVSGRDVPCQEISERVGRFDVIFEAVGIPDVAFTTLAALGPNGVYCFTGVPALADGPRVPFAAAMRRIVLENQFLFGTVNAGRSAYELAVEWLAQFMSLFPNAVRALITERAPLERAPELLRSSGGIKQIVKLGRPVTVLPAAAP